MKANVFFYYSEETRLKMYQDLTVFGARILYDAKIIKKLDALEKITHDLDNGVYNPQVQDFGFNHLIDTVKVIIFFENHLKGMLIYQGFFVNKINRQIPDFKDLAKRQYKEPISFDDMSSDIEAEFNLEKEELFHPALLENTIGMRELMTKSYLDKFKLDKDIIELVKEMIIYRNKLHLHDAVEFSISKDKIAKLKKIKSYVANDVGIINAED